MITQLPLEAQTNIMPIVEDPIAKAIVDEMNQKFAVLEQPTFLIPEEDVEGNGTVNNFV